MSSDRPAVRPDEGTVLACLVAEPNPRPWSLDELGREIGDPIAAADAIAALHAAGLVHRTTDGFLFATRAAVRYHEFAE